MRAVWLAGAALFALAHPAAAQLSGGGGVGVLRTPQTISMSVVTLSTGASTRLVVAKPNRKSLQILNTSTAFCTAGSFATTGTYTVVLGQGYPLEAASGAGHQGGSTPVYDGASTSTDEWDAVCTGPATLLVIEGN